MLLVWKDSIQVSCLFCCIAFCILPVEQTWQVKKSMRRCWWSSPGWCTQLFVSQLELTDVTHVWRCMSFLLDVFYSSLFCLHDFVVLPRNGLRNAGVIPFALTVCSDENDETFVVCSRLKHHWSAYLSFLESLRKTFLTLCPMAAMFFALVVVFLVKHAYGMRGPTQAELMEAERRKCAQRGAGRVDMPYAFGECICPSDRPRVTKECGFTRSNFFRLSDAKPGCRCVTKAEAQELRKMPVAASALRFCDALVDQSKRAAELRPWQDRMSRQDLVSRVMRNITEDTLKKTSPEICQHALTGTISKTEAEKAPWAEKASELSRKGSVQDQDGDRAYGRMRAVKESATTPAEKALWEHALAQVCKDECTDLLNMMKEEARNLANDVEWKHVPFAQTCAERVVQHVEAEVLGCCARSCGFDGRRCLLWPFFSPKEKVEWNLECCAEMNVLKNSSRELMCNSVLPDRLAKKASNFDLEEQSGTDVGKVLLGQNSSLVWTKEGAQESALGKEAKAHGGEKVSMEFLLEHKDVGEEYLRLGYFKEKPLSKILNESTSLVQVSSQDDTCNFGKFQHQCPQKFMTTFVKKCNEAWSVTQESEDSEETNFHDLLTHPEKGNCNQADSQNFATPEECEQLADNSFGKVFLHYFEYNKENKDLPIKCFSLSKEQCKGKDDWWKRIPLVSVQKLMNEQDVQCLCRVGVCEGESKLRVLFSQIVSAQPWPNELCTNVCD